MSIQILAKEKSLVIARAVVALNEVLHNEIGCQIVGVVLLKEEDANLTVMWHPKVLESPDYMKTAIEGVRLSCDQHEEVFCKPTPPQRM